MDQELQELVKQISPSKFDLLADQHQLDIQQRKRARAVLVDRKPVSEVARNAGVTEEAIRKVIRQLVGSSHEQPRLTPELFDAALNQIPRLSEKNALLAKRVLVEGDALASVAADAGMARSTLNKVVNRIKAAAVPEGWRLLTVTLPDALADEVEQMEEDAYRIHLDKQKEQ